MPTSWLLEKNFNEGLKATHYFNGRLLTADALQTDQQAVQTRLDWMGKAAGYGVIEGLVVVQSDTSSMTVSAGIGLNHDGAIIHLPRDTSLKLTQSFSTTAASLNGNGKQADASAFTSRKDRGQAQAQQAQAGYMAVESALGTINRALQDGVYLLTALPTSRFEGSVPMKSSVGSVSSGIGNEPGCGNRWEVDGVQFKAIRLGSSDLHELYAGVEGIQLNDVGNRLRNLLASWCYGTVTVRQFAYNPFTFPELYAPLDPLAQIIPDLTTGDLPLAVFQWDGQNKKLAFVDLWAARRRVTLPDALLGTQTSQSMTWRPVMDDRHVAGKQARFRQFQDQLDGIIAQGKKPGSGIDLSKVQVTDFFTFLPAVGFLPISHDGLQKLLCAEDDEPHKERPAEQEQESWGLHVGLAINQSELRMLGEFAGTAAGALIGVLVPPLGAVSALGLAGRVAGGVGGWLGTLFHLGSFASRTPGIAEELAAVGAAAGSPEVANTIQSLMQRVAELEKQVPQNAQQAAASQPTPQREPQPQERIGATISYHKEEKRTVTKPPHVVFRERICHTISQKRDKDGGFDLVTFFSNYLLRINLIGKDRVDTLLHQSWYQEPIDLRPERHPDPYVDVMGEDPYPVEDGLHAMPLLFDIYLVEENLRDTTQPLYVIFQKGLHPIELIRYYRKPEAASDTTLPQEVPGQDTILPQPQQHGTASIFPQDVQSQ